MEFDSLSFLMDYNIAFAEHSSTTTSNYYGIERCPFCQAQATSNKYYAACGRSETKFTCWVCGWHNFTDFLKAVTGLNDYSSIQAIYKRYGNKASTYSFTKNSEEKPRPTTIKVPGKKKLISNAKKFLEKRNFDPEFVFHKYGMLTTTYESNYSYRLIIPYIYNGRIVSFTARDYTGLQEPRYKGCPKDLEIIPRKEILFNIDNAKKKNVLVVEGEMDALRCGDSAVCVGGTSWTQLQMIMLASKFDNIFIMFDGNEKAALEKAYKASFILSAVGSNVEVLELDGGDPDEVFQDEKELLHLRKELCL